MTIIPFHTELTTNQAADLLNVSHPWLVKELLEKGVIPFHKTGTHRRVYFKGIIAYKKENETKRLEALAELTRLSQDLQLGY